MEKADCIIKAGFVITMEEPGFLVADGAVAVAGGRIADAGPSAQILERYLSEKIIGGPMYALMPGFVNTHTHAPMVFMRGVADDLPLMEWLQKHIWPLEAKWLSPEFVADATALACLEMLKAGVTAYNDMYFYEYAAAPAIKKIGMRAVLGAGIVDFPTKVASNADEYISRAEEFINNIAGEELLTPSVAPHALYTCSPETLGKSARLAERYRVPLHLHLSETKWERDEVHRTSGKSPVNLLESVGALSEKTIAAHCVWLEDQEIEILAGRGVNISHCPESNLKLASGVAPVAKMLKAGLKVSFGTDGAASNNDLNVMGEMATAAKVQKTDSWDPTALDARTALRMATKWGADALGTGGGSIKKGAPADLVLLDIDKPHLTPMYNVFSQLVYAAQASDVDTVMINGKLVLEGRKLLTADEKDIMEKARWWGEKIKGSI